MNLLNNQGVVRLNKCYHSMVVLQYFNCRTELSISDDENRSPGVENIRVQIEPPASERKSAFTPDIIGENKRFSQTHHVSWIRQLFLQAQLQVFILLECCKC